MSGDERPRHFHPHIVQQDRPGGTPRGSGGQNGPCYKTRAFHRFCPPRRPGRQRGQSGVVSRRGHRRPACILPRRPPAEPDAGRPVAATDAPQANRFPWPQSRRRQRAAAGEFRPADDAPESIPESHETPGFQIQRLPPRTLPGGEGERIVISRARTELMTARRQFAVPRRPHGPVELRWQAQQLRVQCERSRLPPAKAQRTFPGPCRRRRAAQPAQQIHPVIAPGIRQREPASRRRAGPCERTGVHRLLHRQLWQRRHPHMVHTPVARTQAQYAHALRHIHAALLPDRRLRRRRLVHQHSIQPDIHRSGDTEAHLHRTCDRCADGDHRTRARRHQHVRPIRREHRHRHRLPRRCRRRERPHQPRRIQRLRHRDVLRKVLHLRQNEFAIPHGRNAESAARRRIETGHGPFRARHKVPDQHRIRRQRGPADSPAIAIAKPARRKVHGERPIVRRHRLRRPRQHQIVIARRRGRHPSPLRPRGQLPVQRRAVQRLREADFTGRGPLGRELKSIQPARGTPGQNAAAAPVFPVQRHRTGGQRHRFLPPGHIAPDAAEGFATAREGQPPRRRCRDLQFFVSLISRQHPPPRKHSRSLHRDGKPGRRQPALFTEQSRAALRPGHPTRRAKPGRVRRVRPAHHRQPRRIHRLRQPRLRRGPLPHRN